MFKVLGNAWKIPELRKKIIFTLVILLIYRLGCVIPVPGINAAYIAEQVTQYNFLGFINLFTGGGLSNMSIFALGVMPYINASIIINLLTVAIPALERLAKEEDGQEKINKITRYSAVGLGLIQAVGILVGFGNEAVESTDLFNYITIVLCLTAGTSLVMWLGEQINSKGIGNGISIIIFIGIVANLPVELLAMITNIVNGNTSIWSLVLLIVVALIIITALTFVDMGERRIPVQYAKRVVGRKQYGGQASYIPMKVNSSGVLPLIFATTFLQIPGMIAQFVPESDYALWVNKYMASGSVLFAVILALLIMFFTYFYSQIAFNPIEVSKNIQQYGGFIPGIRPGRPTSDYLSKILSKITLFGAIFLALVAAVPSLFSTISGMNSALGATSLLILVSVSLETSRSIESQMMTRHYKGFLK